jgi:hypothetical protein
MDSFEMWELGLGVSTSQEKQRLDNVAKAEGLSPHRGQDPLVLLGWTIPPQSHFDLPQNGGKRGSQLVRGITGEAALPFERLLQSVEQFIEGPGQVFQFIARTRQRQALPQAIRIHGPRTGGHLADGSQGSTADRSAQEERQEPKAEGQADQHSRELPQRGLGRFQR